MSKSIDQRIVQMEFDNSQFEQGVKTSLLTLESLKKGLELDKAAASLKNLEETFKGFSVGALENVARAVDNISERFSILGEVGAAALHKITDMAVTAGVDLVKGLSFNNIGAGFEKYEKKMEATMAMQSATGKSVDEITGHLEKLMEFTDQTSYSFSEMVTTMGQFTSAGVTDLGLAEKSVEGIANAAADAGIGIRDAGRIFQIFAKAMSSGKLGRNQWDSLGLANFTTPKFQKALIAAGKYVGTIDAKTGAIAGKSKKVVVGMDNIADTLKDGWATQQVMAKALELYYDTTGKVAENMGEIGKEFIDLGKDAYAAAQNAKTFTDVVDSVKDAVSSGWMKSFEYMFGDLDYARVFFTDMADKVIEFTAAFSDARNAKLADWAEKGGRDDLAAGLFNILDIIEAIRNNAFTAWNYIFYGDQLGRIVDFTGGVDALLKLTEGFKNFTQSIKDWFLVLKHVDGEETYETLYSADLINVFKGLFSILLYCKEAALGFARGLKKIGQKFTPLGKPLLKLFGAIGTNLEKIVKWFSANKIFDTWSDNFVKGLEPITSKIDKVVEWINKLTAVLDDSGALFGDFKKDTLELNSPLGRVAKGFASFGTILSQVGGFAANAFSQIIAAVAPVAGDFINWVLEMSGSLGEWITKVEESGVIATTLETWSGKISNAISTLKEWVDTAKEWIGSTGIIPAIRKEFDEFTKWLGEAIFGNGEEDKVDEFTENVEKESGKISLATAALTAMHDALTNLANWFNEHNLGEMIGEFFGNVSSFVGAAMGKLGEFLMYDTSGKEGALGKFTSRLNVFKEFDEEGNETKSILNQTINTFQEIGDFIDGIHIGTKLSDAVKKIQEFFAYDTSGTEGFFGKFASRFNVFKNVDADGNELSTFLNNVINILQKVASLIDQIDFNGVLETVSGWGTTLSTSFSDAVTAISPYALQFILWVSTMTGSLKRWIDEVNASEVISTTITTWATKIGEAITTLKEWATEAKTWIDSTGILPAIRSEFGEFLTWLAGAVFGNGAKDSVDEFTESVDKETGKVGLATKALDGLHDALTTLANWFNTHSLAGMFDEFFGDVGGFFSKIFGKIGEFFAYDTSDTEGLFSKFTSRLNVLKTYNENGQEVETLLGSIINTIQDIASFVDNIDTDSAAQAVADVIGFFGEVFIKVFNKLVGELNLINFMKATTKLKSAMTLLSLLASLIGTWRSATWFADSFSEFMENINMTLDKLFNNSNGYWLNKIRKVAISFALIAGSLWLIADAASKIGSLGLGGALIGLASLTLLGYGMFKFGTMLSYLSSLKINALSGLVFIEIAKAVDILADSITKISTIGGENNPFGLVKGLFGAGGALAGIVWFTQMLSGYKLSVGSGLAIIEISKAVDILADAIEKIGKLREDNWVAGVLGAGGALWAIVTFTKLLDGVKIGVGSGLAIIEIAAAVNILADAIEKIGSISAENELATIDGALIAGGALWALVEFTKQLNGFKVGLFNGLAIIEIAGAVNLLANAIAQIAAIGAVFGDDKALEGGLIVGGALWALVEFTKQLTGMKVGIFNGLAILEIASAVGILAQAISEIASIDISNNNLAIADGTLAVGGALWALVEFSKQLVGVDIGIKSGVALIEIAGAVGILAQALVSIGQLEPDKMMSGLVGTTGVSGILIAFATAIDQADIGVATGFTFIELAGAIELMADGLKKLSKLKWEDLGKGLGGMAAAITEELVAVTFLKGVSIGDIAKVLVDIGAFIGGFTAIFTALAELSAFIEEKAGIDVIEDLDKAAEMVGKLGAIFGSFFGGIVGGFSGARQAAETAQDAQSFEELISSFTKFGDLATGVNFESIESFLGMMEHFKEVGNLSAPIFDASGTLMSINPLEMLGNTLYTLSDGMERLINTLDAVNPEKLANLASFSQILNALTTAAGSLGDPTEATQSADALRQFFDVMAGMDLWGYDIGDAAGKIAAKFTTGFNENIQNGSSSAQAAAQAVGQAAVNGVDAYTVQFQGVGWDMMSGLAQGILEGGDAVVNAVASIASRAKAKMKSDLSIASPSKVFAEMGMYVDLGFAEGITKYANRAEDATDILSGKAISSMKDGLHNFSAIIAEDINPNPTIRPVLDMTDVMAGLTTMDDAFASRNVIGLSGVQVGNIYGRNVLGPAGNQTINVNNADVVAAIDAINARLDSLTENLGNLQVVMNTGALVGEIAPAMDRELGSLAISGGRRG